MVYKITITIIAIVAICCSIFFGYKYFANDAAYKQLVQQSISDLNYSLTKCDQYIAIARQLRIDKEELRKNSQQSGIEYNIIRDRANKLQVALESAIRDNVAIKRAVEKWFRDNNYNLSDLSSNYSNGNSSNNTTNK